MTSTSINDIMFGYHVCFWSRGNRFTQPVQLPATPEDIILNIERTYLALLAASEEASPIRLAINLILREGLSMAEACRLVSIEKYQLSRAIKRIAMRLDQEG